MDDNLQDRTIGPKIEKEQMKIDAMVIPGLIILVVMLTLVSAQQHRLIGEYKTAVAILEEDRAEMLESHNELWEDVSFAVQTLAEVDLNYIEAIPTGAELRIQLALDALMGVGQ